MMAYLLPLLGIGAPMFALMTYLELSPPQAAIVAALAGLLAMGVVWVVKRIRARRAAKKLEGALAAQGEEQAATVRPDLQPEIKAMQDEFTKAVGALKASKLARGGKDALAVLPWYLIVGPPGAGKSTALRNSGLKFPYLSARGGVRGVGGTRNCDWWLTNEAVILDTAGRYTSAEEDRPEWMAFLDTVVKHRPSRPINGLIVAISVSELMTADPQAVGEMGQTIRERLDEITGRLKMLVPVYVMVTKCDLLPGFVEMFSDLSRVERGQVWGFTVPLEHQKDASTDLFRERFDEMLSVLEQRSLRRLGQERRLETRENIYGFPQRFDALRKNLAEFLQPLFLENVFQDTPVFRGLYFNSGTQDVRAVDKVSPSAGEMFGTTNGRPQTDGASAEGRSYFLWDVFTKVMFQDQQVAVRSSLEEARVRRQSMVLAGAAMAATALLLSMPTLSYFQNRFLAEAVTKAITDVNLDPRDDVRRVEDLLPLSKRLEELTRHEEEGAPVWMRFGLYQGHKLLPQAREFYNTALRRVLLGKQFELIQQRLEGFARSPDMLTLRDPKEHARRSSEFKQYVDDLKMYLLVTTPRDPKEPELDETQRRWLVQQIVEHWGRVRGSALDEGTVATHATTFIKMLGAEQALPDEQKPAREERIAFPREHALIVGARRALIRVPLEKLELARIVETTRAQYGDVTLEQLMGSVPQFSANMVVRGAFTRNAYENEVKQQLEQSFSDQDAWVLDRDVGSDVEGLRRVLHSNYLSAYIQEWKDFLNAIKVVEPKDDVQLDDLLTNLTRGTPKPYSRLFNSIVNNVQLERRPPKVEATSTNKLTASVQKIFGSGDDAVTEKNREKLNPLAPSGEEEILPRDVAREFASIIRFATERYKTDDGEETLTALVEYEEQLVTVHSAMLAAKDKPGEGAELAKKSNAARSYVEMLIRKQTDNIAIFHQLLMPPFKDTLQVLTQGQAQQKSKLWCEQVAVPFNRAFKDMYPFTASSQKDAPLPEVAEFLRPDNGQLRKFIKEQLSEQLVPTGRKWDFTSSASGNYRPELLTFLEKTQALAATLFPGGESVGMVDPLVRFQVRIRPGVSMDGAASQISSIVFTLDGTDEVYRNGPDTLWKPMIWPGQAGKLGARILVQSVDGATESTLEAEGDWGLFRLLERVKKIEPSPDGRYFTATWEIEEMNGAQVSIDFRPERTTNPFFGLAGNTSKLMGIFRDSGMKVPMGIALNGKGCEPEAVAAGGAP
ncbi:MULTISPECIES: type VI secretion system membrane subunit TssM [Myxococcus]|uniref:Type VI secretion system membrane subunit TssM n=1 Tax=Myxococcus llanfairpwllgwyngyllgogerychwyrndrobwllllantysiliogogogochensis TaxID=2590453 RepID=A0A540WLU0_9BACT|nr:MULTISPECIES: type VI secretion system membrane subunit TssM [Myxococcus]NTX08527.1 type VI secretion system membrane subunit TssM [Myxococcus sp. CA040A]TQF09979.1 type VI secretion system membrane subunit TssM [Myxococcus llanfairpwllgwyngyllgogerychwyrndrobwllllantysiliogogogochensis]